MDFPGRNLLFILVVGLLVVPLQSALIPVLQLTTQIWAHRRRSRPSGWRTPASGCRSPSSCCATSSGSCRREMFESAYLDGASPTTAFFRLVLPLSVPAIASLVIFQFMFVWNDLLVALILVGGTADVAPMTVTIANLVNSLRPGLAPADRRGLHQHGPAAGRVLQPAALLRARHPRRSGQGLTRGATSFVARASARATRMLDTAVTSVHVVPHTHWDREWYRPFQDFRMRLVDVVDRVLDMLDAEPELRFTLDGQVAIVDDYLEIRPERESRIRELVESGRLAIGPWQILMDEFLVSGESLVRNLEMGWRRADELGGPMPIGYLPDMFGHVAQMPQILRRAGLTDAVVWRGVPAAVDRHAFRWESPDGSAVRAEYLAAGYDNAALLSVAPDQATRALDRLADEARPWFGTDPMLAMAGTDHTAPAAELATLLRRLGDASGVRIGTIADYVAAAPPLAPDAPRGAASCDRERVPTS